MTEATRYTALLEKDQWINFQRDFPILSLLDNLQFDLDLSFGKKKPPIYCEATLSSFSSVLENAFSRFGIFQLCQWKKCFDKISGPDIEIDPNCILLPDGRIISLKNNIWSITENQIIMLPNQLEAATLLQGIGLITLLIEEETFA